MARILINRKIPFFWPIVKNPLFRGVTGFILDIFRCVFRHYLDIIHMDAGTIKFRTIQFLNGTKYINREQLEPLCYLMCDIFGIEKTEENFVHVREACNIYFSLDVKLNTNKCN